MADYDAGELTEREKLAGQHQQQLGGFNADTIKNQLAQQIANYDLANRQNRRLADVQLIQNSRKNSVDRFQAQRDLQNAALGLLGSMNQAMQGSTVGNFMRMVRDRADKDNVDYWQQLQENNDQVENSYDESVNSNVVARNDAVSNAQSQLRGIEADTAANLNNINPNLYVEPGTGDTNFGSGEIYDQNKAAENRARLSGYAIPANAQRSRYISRNQLGQERQRRTGVSDYYSQLLNGFNGR